MILKIYVIISKIVNKINTTRIISILYKTHNTLFSFIITYKKYERYMYII